MPAKVKTAATPEAAIRAAVRGWAKTEAEVTRMTGSALWNLIHECRRALGGGIAEGNVRTYLVSEIEQAFGEGASKSRSAHISKIMKIANEATPADFERWEKDGTGFYKAYQEFAKPQAASQNKAPVDGGKAKEVIIGEGSANGTPKPEGWTDPNLGTEAKTEEQNKDLADPDWSAKPSGGAQAVPAASGKQGEAKPASDPTPAWATRIEQDRSLWGKLIDSLGNGLTVEMVIQVFESLHRRQAVKMKNVVEELMQEPRFAKIALAFIKDNPTMMSEVPASAPEIISEEVGVEEAE